MFNEKSHAKGGDAVFAICNNNMLLFWYLKMWCLCGIEDTRSDASVRPAMCATYRVAKEYIFFFSFSINRYMSCTHSLTTSRLSFSTISPLFVSRFKRLRLCHLEFDKEAISDDFREILAELQGSLWTLLYLFLA